MMDLAWRMQLAALGLGASHCLLPGASAEIPDALLSTPLAATFGAPPAIGRPQLSPDGSKLLFLQQNAEGAMVVQVLDFANGAIVGVASGTEEGYDVGWCEWVNGSRIFCDSVFAVDADGSDFIRIDRGAQDTPPERDTGCALSEAPWATSLRFDRLPDEPEFISISCGTTSRLNVYAGRSQRVNRRPNFSGSALSDGHDFVRLRREADEGPLTYRWYSRDSIEGEWTRLYEYRPRDFDDPFMPIGFGANVDALFHFARLADRWALFGRDLAGSDQSRLIFAHPVLDLRLVDAMGAHDRIVAAAFLDGRPERFVVDARVAEAYGAAVSAFPGQNVEVVDEDWNGESYLVLARPPERAGTFYLMNLDRRTVAEIGQQHPALADTALADTRTLAFAAPDGGTIAGHLTLPADGERARGAVIVPQAYPSRLDIADPHFLVQYLAASGYAVLRVQYRGPPEIGPWLPERTVIGSEQAAADVDAAVSYLIESGIADADGICALGRDIGAYVAFMSAIEYPGRLACIVGIGTISDARSIIGSSTLAEQGGDFVELLRDASPSRRADEVAASTLLFHGVYDGLVPILNNSRDLHQALERAGVDTQFIEYPYARHDIERAPYRIDMLARIGAFLDLRLSE